MANSDGHLTAFNADTGAVNWSLQTKSAQSYESVPTAFDGVVYFGGDSQGAVIYAITEASGVVDWNTTPLNGESGQLAVDDDGVFLSFACQQDFRFSITGTLIWHNDTGCGGRGVGFSVLANGYVYDEGQEGAPQRWDPPEILSVPDGRQVGSFRDELPPAFGSSNMYVFHKDTLITEGPLGRPNHWEFGSRQNFAPVNAPVTDKSMVFIGAADGEDLDSLRTGPRSGPASPAPASTTSTDSHLPSGTGCSWHSQATQSLRSATELNRVQVPTTPRPSATQAMPAEDAEAASAGNPKQNTRHQVHPQSLRGDGS